MQTAVKQIGVSSRFIEEVVTWRVLQQTIAETRRHFADLPPEELDALIDEAVAAVRHARRAADC